MQEYTLVSQDFMRVEHYLRHNEQWILTEFGSPDDIVQLTSINCELPLREIYAKVDFPPNEASSPSPTTRLIIHSWQPHPP